jgi:hypothetical protein
MNAENYRRFLAAIGHRIIASPSGYWSDVARWFYESIPPSRVMTFDRAEINALFRQHRVIGLKYCAPQDHVGKPSWIYIRQDKDYDLKSLHPKMRNKVRQGLRNCTVRPVSFEYLRDHGMPLNLDTLERQGRDDPLFSQPAGWARLCQAGQQIEGAGAWGAFVGDQLAAYMITFVTDGYYNILHQMSRMDLLKTRANNALAFVATQEMLASPGIQAVSYGQASIRELPGLQEYKVRLGYEKRPMRHVVVLHPLLGSIFLSRGGDALLGALNRLFPDHDVLKRLNGIVDIARQSRGAESGCERRIELERRSGNAQETL